MNQFFKAVFIGGLNQIVLNQLHGDGVAQSVHAIDDSFYGKPSCSLFWWLDSGENARLAAAGPKNFGHVIRLSILRDAVPYLSVKF